MLMRILLPFTDTSGDPLMIAREVAKVHSKNSEIIALYVVDIDLIKKARSYSESLPPDEIENMLVTSEKQHGKNYLNTLQQEFEKRGFKFRQAIRVGNVVDEILKEAKDSAVDMITLLSTDNIDVHKLSRAAPLMITVLKFGRVPFPGKEVAITMGLAIVSMTWYYFIFSNLDFVNEYVLAKKVYSGIVVWLILLLTVALYGTFVGKVLKFIGLDTKSAH
jgi:nucleotide-binding universal stress UspA family protein